MGSRGLTLRAPCAPLNTPFSRTEAHINDTEYEMYSSIQLEYDAGKSSLFGVNHLSLYMSIYPLLRESLDH